MNLEEVGTEILNDGFVVVRAVSERRYAAESKFDREKKTNM